MDTALTFSMQKNHLTITLAGDFIHYENNQATHPLWAQVRGKSPKTITFNSQKLQNWDSSLLVLIYRLMLYAAKHDIRVDTAGLPIGLQRLLTLAFTVDRKPTTSRTIHLDFLSRIGQTVLIILNSIQKGMHFIHTVLKSVVRAIAGLAIMRPIDFWFALDDCGPKAIGIVSLISFMVGLILAFVGAIQLKTFGAQIYVASLVAIGMTRIMGAIMVGIIMAGRTGASYAATIGTMQVNEELDALQTMGISRTDFLVLPRLFALVLAMPFLALLADIMGMVGGAAVGVFMLGISPSEYMHYSMEAFNLTNFFVGVFHGLVFGFVIALCGCYFGIHSGRNADSVGVATTRAVVYAIVWMIVMTGIITLVCEVLGI